MNKIILIIGFPGAGKSSLVKSFTDQGYTNLNRDTFKGTLLDFNTAVENTAKRLYHTPMIIDNTYSSIESRKEVIRIAKTNGYEIECHWLKTTLEQAQVNVVRRMINITGTLLDPKGMVDYKHPNIYGPAVQYKYKKDFQKPTLAEGFDKIVEVPFIKNPLGLEYKNKAIIVDYDGTLRKTKSGNKFPVEISDIEILPNRKVVLQKYLDKGYLLLGVSNQSGVAKKLLTHERAIECFEETNRLLGLSIDYHFCPHSVPPIICYCRKPLPGLGVLLIEKHKLNPDECIFIGDMTSDKTFAERSGFKFALAENFFKL